MFMPPGGSQMIKEAVAGLPGIVPINWAKPDLFFLAVTVLTSLNNEDLKEIGFQKKHG